MPAQLIRTAKTDRVPEAPLVTTAVEAAKPDSPRPKPVLMRWVMPVLAFTVLAAIAALLVHLVAGFDLSAVTESVVRTPGSLIALSLFFSGISYTALIGYDVLALRAVTDKSVPFSKIALGSFSSYAIGHTLGFPLVTAGAVRWRVYSSAGLSLADVAKLTTVAALTLWMGMAAVLGLSALAEPETLAGLDRFPVGLNRSIGLAIVAGLVLWLVWGSRRKWEIGRGAKRIRLPDGKTGLVQVGLGLIDVSAAAAALWVLLPNDITIGLPEFAAIFAIAVVLAMISHVPAGLGSFEAIMLVTFPSTPVTELLSALIVWRLTYTLIPFLLAATLVGAYELRRPDTRLAQMVQRGRRLAAPFVPVALAVLTFLGGLVLLTSGALPSDYSRIRALRHLVPLPFAEVSHLVGSSAGVMLLILSRGLMRRLAGAWTLTVFVIGTGIVVSLAKGFDWEEALVLAAVLTLLLTYRSTFYRRTGIFAGSLELRWLFAIAVIIGCTIWLGLTAFQDVDYSHDLWWQFDWHDDASRFLRGSLAAVIVGAALALYALLDRPSVRRKAPAPNIDALAPALSQATRADAQLAHLADKRFLIHEAGDAFLMYAVRGKSWIVMGDPVGNPERAADLVWEFLDLVDRYAGWPVFYQVSPTHLPLYLDGGLSLIKLGEEARVDLGAFSTEGRAGKDWRAALNRAKRNNLEFAVIPASEAPACFAELKAVSDAWLTERGTGEKGFSIGFWSETYLSHFDIAVVRHDGKILAFANLWYGQVGGELSVDLMRGLPHLPTVMDFLFVRLMQEGKARGYRWFNLGMAPLSGLSGHRLAPRWHKVAAFIACYGEHLYGFKGLRDYKEKFGPVWEPRYLACPGGWALPQILFDVTSLVSGSPIRAVSKGAGS